MTFTDTVSEKIIPQESRLKYQFPIVTGKFKCSCRKEHYPLISYGKSDITVCEGCGRVWDITWEFPNIHRRTATVKFSWAETGCWDVDIMIYTKCGYVKVNERCKCGNLYCYSYDPDKKMFNIYQEREEPFLVYNVGDTFGLGYFQEEYILKKYKEDVLPHLVFRPDNNNLEKNVEKNVEKNIEKEMEEEEVEEKEVDKEMAKCLYKKGCVEKYREQRNKLLDDLKEIISYQREKIIRKNTEKQNEKHGRDKCSFISPCGSFKGKMLCPAIVSQNEKYCEFHQVLTNHLRLDDYPLESEDDMDREKRWDEFVRNGI